jgi:phosphatidate cytidylyltransferase
MPNWCFSTGFGPISPRTISKAPWSSFTAAIGATVPPNSAGALPVRVLSSIVLIGLSVGAVVAGGPYFAVFAGLFGMAMCWEWSIICNQGRLGRSGVAAVVVTLSAIVLGALGSIDGGVAAVAIGAGVIWAVGRGIWPALGVPYAALACLSLLWLRAGAGGLVTVLWVFALVWSADTFAYGFGRLLGGPRLAPRISPKKTWAGLGGAIAGAAGTGAAFWALGIGPGGWGLVALGAGLAVVEQAGDLLESAYKRRFNVKDSSHLIPGHGGVLDRVDGLVAVVLAVAALRLAGLGSIVP